VQELFMIQPKTCYSDRLVNLWTSELNTMQGNYIVIISLHIMPNCCVTALSKPIIKLRFVAFPVTEYDEVFLGYQLGQMVER